MALDDFERVLKEQGVELRRAGPNRQWGVQRNDLLRIILQLRLSQQASILSEQDESLDNGGSTQQPSLDMPPLLSHLDDEEYRKALQAAVAELEAVCVEIGIKHTFFTLEDGSLHHKVCDWILQVGGPYAELATIDQHPDDSNESELHCGSWVFYLTRIREEWHGKIYWLTLTRVPCDLFREIWHSPYDWPENWRGFITFDLDHLSLCYRNRIAEEIRAIVEAWALKGVALYGLHVDRGSFRRELVPYALSVLAASFREHKEALKSAIDNSYAEGNALDNGGREAEPPEPSEEASFPVNGQFAPQAGHSGGSSAVSAFSSFNRLKLTANLEQAPPLAVQDTKINSETDIVIVCPDYGQTSPTRTPFTFAHGPRRIRSYLASKGFKAAVVEFNMHRRQEFIDRIKESQPAIIGFSILYDTLEQDIENIWQAKQAHPDAIIVMGGVEATNNAQEYIRKLPIDVLVLGEGEIPLLEMCRLIPKDKRITRKDIARVFAHIPGLLIKTPSGNIVGTGPARILTQEEYLEVFRAYEIDLNEYRPYWDWLEELSSRRGRALMYATKVVRLVTSNYCPFGCSFCAGTCFLRNASGIEDVPLRCVPAIDIVEKIEEIIAQEPEIAVYLDDETFLIDRERAREFCRLIIEMGI
jgi:hypothetical protein